MLTYGKESLPLERKDENMLQIFDRCVLRIIYGPIKENGTWKDSITMNFRNYIMNQV
jgi:hypothetical protein